MAPWKLPVIVAAIAVPIVGAFALGGGGAGVAVGALAVVALVLVAARQRPRGPIGTTPAVGGPRQLLLVVTCVVEEPAAVRRIAAVAGLDGGRGDTDVLVLSPAKLGFLDRWASDVEGARHEAQQNLVATVAALAKAGIAAEARVGDEDVVQAVEDQLQSFTANEVVLVSDGAEDDDSAAAELEARLRAEFRHVVLDRA
ncbi:MAG TPA: hypothetical protein VLK56_10520 [Solirubrobacterales bacterium]|nr:hypothetical protein [Solirubrobacterales bacterium]